jgi:MFS family permease
VTDDGATGDRPEASSWAPLKSPVFLAIWLAVLVSNIGTWVRDVASGWLMTEMSPSPLLVSMVQAATTLPIFLLSLPAGAVADIVDRRRLLIGVQIMLLCVGLTLTSVAYLGLMTPAILIGLIMLGGVGAALSGPAFQAIVPELVDRGQLRPAVALNSLGINVARAIGPALGGLIVATLGVAAAFLFDALSYLLIMAVFLMWKRKPVQSALPPEAFGSAMRAGFRYAAGSPDLKRVLLRAAAFFFFASAYWALLPLIARERLNADAPYYGILLASIGAGAVTGALLLPRLKLPGSQLVFAGSLLTAIVTGGLALNQDQLIAPLLLFCAGVAWIAVLTNLNVAAQSVLPNWVRARGLAVYLMVHFGAMTAGSALWGLAAQETSITTALLVAAGGGAVFSFLAAWFVGLPKGEGDLSPGMHWAEPVTAGEIQGDRGPVLVTISYEIDVADRRAFLDKLQQLAVIRKRDGAFGWRVLEDAAEPKCFDEIFFAASWLEHLRQHQRITGADRIIQQEVLVFHKGTEPPAVRHLIGARADDHGALEPIGDHRH